MAAWREYLRNLGERLLSDADNEAVIVTLRRRETLLIKLIYEFSHVLNFKLEQSEILEGDHLPQGSDDDDLEQRVIRKALIDVLNSRRPIMFQPYTPREGTGPYPPTQHADRPHGEESGRRGPATM